MTDFRVTHRFHSDKPDGPDDTKLRPSNWNDDHLFDGILSPEHLDLTGVVPVTTTVNGHPLSASIVLTKSDIGLDSVENVAISTWAGSSNITTTGTVTSGTWSATLGAVSGAALTHLTAANIDAGIASIDISGHAASATTATTASSASFATNAGNATTVTDGIYTTGSYSDPSWITALAKAKVGLGLVENTALSTWAGSSNLTTLGTLPKAVVTGLTSAQGAVADVIGTTRYPLVQINSSFTDASALTQQTGLLSSFSVNPSGSWTAKQANAAVFTIASASANAQNIGTINAVSIGSRHLGSGTLTNLTANSMDARTIAGAGNVTTVMAASISAVHNASSAVTTMQGANVAMINGSTGTIGAVTCVRASWQQTAAGTISGDLRYVEIAALVNAGTITGTTYGFYVPDITTGTQTGGAYSFYNSDANAPVFFASNCEALMFKTSTAIVTATGGATPSFLTNGVGGTGGPTTSSQNGWLKHIDSTGATVWIPVWK